LKGCGFQPHRISSSNDCGTAESRALPHHLRTELLSACSALSTKYKSDRANDSEHPR